MSIEIIPYEAPQAVRDALEQIGRTEDVRFSPSNRRLALAGFGHNSIGIVDVDITMAGNRPRVTVTDVAEFSSPRLDRPHGVDFLDDETIIIANRGGSVTVFRLPTLEDATNDTAMTLIDPPSESGFELLNSPGSLAIASDSDGGIEVLVCNNSGHTITRHTFEDDPLVAASSDILLRQWLDLPDGLAVSADGRWLAISNHNAHSVMVYERTATLHEGSEPVCILRGVSYPHGLCFTADARHLFVADAGKPFVFVFTQSSGTWRGVQQPAASLRVMDQATFEQHPRRYRGEGGPKGVDIDRDGRVLTVTSEFQRLGFFDLSAILDRSTGECPDHAQQVSVELELMELARKAETYIVSLTESRSFRLTKPLRQLKATVLRKPQ